MKATEKLSRVVCVFFVGAVLGLTVLCFVSKTPLDAQAPENEARVRPATVAGTFYPGTMPTLSKAIDSMLQEASPVQLDGGNCKVNCDLSDTI